MKEQYLSKQLLKYGGIMVLVTAAFFLGKLGRSDTPEAGTAVSKHDHAGPEIWTCSMHPQIKLPKKGKCPICFMDLIPLKSEGSSDDGVNPNNLVLSKNAQALAGIVTAPVIRRGVTSDITMSGKVAFDETRVETIASRISGRIDKLYANITGIQVKTGDHLAQIYSPELVSVQQELVSAARAIREMPESASDLVRTNAEQMMTAAKEKLRLLGFSAAEIAHIIERNSASDHMIISAGQEGVIISKLINEGDYINTGSPLFRIADLRTVWVMLDAYESDLAWLRLGQRVEFTVEAFAGETFSGTISLIDPVVDPLTRTVKIRVIANNKDLRLKPDMFVKGRAKAQVSQSGKVKSISLRGKWISPMHPQIVKDGPGTCDICGMPLVPAESLGYVTSGYENVNPLIIPATAPLLTGERAIVYIEVTTDSTGSSYEGREVVLGPRVNDYYVVKSGLAEGEMIVVNGAFRIDSELQIHAKPSMMSPDKGFAQTGHSAHGSHSATETVKKADPVPAIVDSPVSSEFIAGLAKLMDTYFNAAEALAKDDLTAVKGAFDNAEKARSAVKTETGKVYGAWSSASKVIAGAMAHRAHLETIADARVLFEQFSTQVIILYRHYGKAIGSERFVAFCPMAFDNKGAYWLQKEETINNPYFGPKMLRCGEIRK
jgi:Cu(I)/Ag(I) efflux system membrane fusion protein